MGVLLKEVFEDDFWIMPQTPQYVESGVPYITSKNIKKGKIDFSNVNYISAEDYQSISKNRPIKEGDILISMIGTLGETAVVKQEDGNFYGQNMFLVRLDKEKISERYFLNYFNSSKVKYDLERSQNQSTQRYLKANHIEDLIIQLPDLGEQQFIARKLDMLSGIIEKRRKELEELDKLIKSRFVEMFGSGRYPMVKAAEVCDFITKGTTPPTGEITEKYEIGMIPYLKVYNLSFTGELLFDNMPQYISADTHNKQLARSKVLPNDVLMNIVGPPLGKFSLVTDEFLEWNINQAIAIFRAKDRVLPRYLLAALMQPDVLRPFLDKAVGVRQLNLSLEQCRNLEFPLPPIEEQRAFVEISGLIDKSKIAVQKSLEETQLLMDSLMQKYFG